MERSIATVYRLRSIVYGLWSTVQNEYNRLAEHGMSTRVVFMGSPAFAVPILEALARDYDVVGVVTQPDRPAGRGGGLRPPPVKVCAAALGLPVIQPERLGEADAMAQLRAWAPQLIVVAAFGQILKPAVLELPSHGCLNVHASLLPRWRGASPIQAAILAGDAQTGVTIMKMDAGVDTGPILLQRATSISSEDTALSLAERLAHMGAELLLEALPAYLEGRLSPQPQPEQGVTYAPLLRKEDGRLDFQKSAVELERQVRAMNPWPGAWFEWRDARIQVWRARVSHEETPGVGQRGIVDGYPAIGTADRYLILEEVQPAGRKAMSGKAFLAGARKWLS